MKDLYYAFLFVMLITIMVMCTFSIDNHIDNMADSIFSQCRVISVTND